MRTPAFWYGEPGAAAALLAPVAGLFALGGRIQTHLARPQKVDVPVICVGNLVAGGTGKTPVALALAELLGERRIAFLTRGYGGSKSGPLKVQPHNHRAGEVGDEALLLARAAPTWLAHDRVAGARAAIADGAGLIVMDDGFQNPSLSKDLSFVVVDGATGFGNGRLLPAGPLREPVADGLARASAVVIVGDDTSGVAHHLPPDLPVLHGELAPTDDAQFIAGRRVVAFAGIGRPAKFFATLDGMGCTLTACHAFADHHRYKIAEVMNICVEAAALDATVVTTEKDWVRLPQPTRAMVQTVPVALRWQDANSVRALLTRVL